MALENIDSYQYPFKSGPERFKGLQFFDNKKKKERKEKNEKNEKKKKKRKKKNARYCPHFEFFT